jgi:hypothetical protein
MERICQPIHAHIRGSGIRIGTVYKRVQAYTETIRMNTLLDVYARYYTP